MGVPPKPRTKETKKGLKLLGMSGGKGRSLLTFDRMRPTKSILEGLSPELKIRTMLRFFENEVAHLPSRKNAWHALRIVRNRFPEFELLRSKQNKFGPIPGINSGDRFPGKAALHLVGLHCKPVSGIDVADYYDEKLGMLSLASSIVVSGVYEDNHDEGHKLTYTGEGGNDLKGTRRQIQDQKRVGGNLSMIKSYERGKPVRVIRVQTSTIRGQPTKKEYSYDGMYMVYKYEETIGISKFKIFKFSLRRLPNQPPLQWSGGRGGRGRG